jgi:hypothetical protein
MIEEFIRSRQFLAEPKWQHHGPIERRLGLWLDPRQKLVAEFLFPQGLALTECWLRACRVALVGAAASWILTASPGDLKFWFYGVAAVVAGLMIFPTAFSYGRAFQGIISNGLKVPFYAGLPLGYREIGLVLFKIGALECLTAALPAILYGAFGAWLAGGRLVLGAELGLKAVCFLLALRPALVALAFSSSTDDSSRIRLRSLGLILVTVPSAILFLTFAAGGYFFPHPLVAWAFTLAAAGVSFGFYSIYGYFFNANRFDLMQTPQR